MNEDEELFYEPELPNDHVDVMRTRNNTIITWDRVDSNENLKRMGFSHYLSSLLYHDNPFVYDPASVKTRRCMSFSRTIDERSVIFLMWFYLESVNVVKITACCATKKPRIVEGFWDYVFDPEPPNAGLPLPPPGSRFYDEDVQKEWRESADATRRVIEKLTKKEIEKSTSAYDEFIKQLKSKTAHEALTRAIRSPRLSEWRLE